MKVSNLLITSSLILSFCGEKPRVGDDFKFDSAPEKVETSAASVRIDLENKGIGPVRELALDARIDQDMVKAGEKIFQINCLACHKAEEKFIGPAMKGVTARRSPEWIMNMILNPNQMVGEDPLAKELFLEFNGLPMSDMNLTESEAREVLEYFRTL